MTRSLRVCVGCAAILLLAIYAFVPSAVYAQQTLGSIDGTVTDSSGAVVPQDGLPYVNPNDFFVPSLAPGTDGVPPCETVTGYSVCDNYETGYGTTGRNIFREPFQTRFDFSVFKNFKLTERFNLKFEADAFNLFNHPSLDAPYSDFTLNPCYNPVPCYTTTPPSYEGYGAIDGTIGSNRFMQFALHLTF